jgi:phosphate transport system protein
MIEHTDKRYEADLERLRQSLVRMGATVDQMVTDALRAFETRDAALAQRTIDTDRDVNRIEIDTDDLCVRLIATKQPTASDLRLITIALKIVTDLERIGDLAVNISERAREVAALPPGGVSVDLKRLGALAQGLFRDALEAFVDQDVSRAEEVLDRDRVLDARYAETIETLLTTMRDQTESLPYATRAFAVAKYLERLGDHATNVAEMVVFMVKGKDIRHRASRGEP